MSKIELVPASALHPALYNPRESDPRRLELVRVSLQKLGFLLPLVATEEGEILSGHQRHSVAVSMGATLVPVMRISVPPKLERGVNILFNRATNDMEIQDTEQQLNLMLEKINLERMASLLPDIEVNSPAFFPCISVTMLPVVPLAQKNVSAFVRHAANVGRMLAHLHIALPIVATEEGIVVNGIGRLEAAARKGWKTIPVVQLSQEKADFARAMLNLLSMDFHFSGENADYLRVGSYRRAWLHRTYLGRAFVLPVYSHKRLSSVRLDDAFMAKWRGKCGNIVLDFGSGQGDEARMLREVGVEVVDFEPYPADGNTINRDAGRASALGFLSAVRADTQFSAIFLSSVLNSVPFPEDRERILCIVAALCGPETKVFAAARCTKSSAWSWIKKGESMSERASRACSFPLSMEKGVTMGDMNHAPKIQKFFEKEEFEALFLRFFEEVKIGVSDGMVTACCGKARPYNPHELVAALRFEFDLPYPDEPRMGLADTAVEAFSWRLQNPLGEI